MNVRRIIPLRRWQPSQEPVSISVMPITERRILDFRPPSAPQMPSQAVGVTDTPALQIRAPAFDPFVMAITSPHPAFRQIAATATE
jgi:hypothetical protein